MIKPIRPFFESKTSYKMFVGESDGEKSLRWTKISKNKDIRQRD